MKTYASFPGCSASTTGRAYTESFTYVADAIGLECKEIEDWNCCGSSVAAGVKEDLGDAFSARNLALSEQQFGDAPVLALCAACYQNLKHAQVRARSSEDERKQIEYLVDMPYEASAEVVNGIEPFLEEDAAAAVKEKVTSPLTGLKVACYYGCMLLRPRSVCTFDDEENPMTMESVVELTGAQCVDWAFKTKCCGASHQVSMAKTAKPLIAPIFENAAAAGAQAIATACPLCMLNLDMREAEVNKKRRAEGKEEFDIPVYYFTELLAASFGASAEESGIKRHFHPATRVIDIAAAGKEDAAKAPASDPELEAFEAKIANLPPEKAEKARAAFLAKRAKAQEQAEEGGQA